MNKTVKKIIAVVVFLLVASALFVVADYYELFGATVEKRLSFSEVRFRTIDADNGRVIMNAGVHCFQKGIMNACTLKDSHQLGIVSVNVPIQRAVKKTILFKKAEEIYKTIDPDINIMIIHSDYHNPIVKLKMEELYSNRIIEKTVEMSPKDWGDSDTESEEVEQE